jgi:glycosyltransferase involved in cell wall biosynthesis
MDLGVYVATLDEDVLIEATLKNLVKVFPQVEVIDLGSRDKTVEIVKRLGVPINRHVLTAQTGKNTFDGPAQQWIQLKNDYANKHDWILLLDGDEIFDEENLLKLKAKAESNARYTSYHIGWKMAREVKGVKQVSNMIVSGPKLYKGCNYFFDRGWPQEILKRNPNIANSRFCDRDIKEECNTWCWHGVLLNRSSTPERTARKKKRKERWGYYDEQLKWEDVEKWPWM